MTMTLFYLQYLLSPSCTRQVHGSRLRQLSLMPVNCCAWNYAGRATRSAKYRGVIFFLMSSSHLYLH